MERKGGEECVAGCKKHPCEDCTFCQWCSDDRCRMCKAEKKGGKKLSQAEQIALYEEINRR